MRTANSMNSYSPRFNFIFHKPSFFFEACVINCDRKFYLVVSRIQKTQI